MQIVSKMKKWVGMESNSIQQVANNTDNKMKGEWHASSSSVSNLGVKRQNSGGWMRKWIPLLLILAVSFWAVSHFTDSNPLSGLWSKADNSVQILEANLDGELKSTSANGVMDAVKSLSSTFDLPNGESIEFSEGSFGHGLTWWLANGEMEEGNVFTFDKLNFVAGSADLTEESKVQLKNLAQVLSAYPAVQIRIEGHTDNIGNAAANKLLSQQRAESAKEWLVTYENMDATRIATQGWGHEKPFSSNDTPEDRLQNSRIDLVITQK